MGSECFKLHGPGEEKRTTAESRSLQANRLAAISNLLPELQTLERRCCQEPRAHKPWSQRLGPGTITPSLPSSASELRGEWLLLSPGSPAPGPLPQCGGPLPQSGGVGSPMGAWRGRARAPRPWGLEEVSVARQPREGPRALRLPAPHTKAPTVTPHLPARAGSGRRRAGRQAGRREVVQASVRVSACVPVSVCASVSTVRQQRVAVLQGPFSP